MFHEVVDGGHAWPSSPLAEPDSLLAEQITELQGYTTDLEPIIIALDDPMRVSYPD